MILTVWIAREKSLGVTLWVFLGILFGPVAVVIVMIMPSGKRESAVSGSLSSTASRDTLLDQFAELKEEMRLLSNKFNNLEARLGEFTVDESAPVVPEPAYQPSIEKPLLAETTDQQPARQEPQPQTESMPEPAAAGKGDIEMDLGKFWLNKIGIIIFSLGIGFLLTYAFAHVGPAAKILFGYLVAAALFIGGIKMERTEKFVNYGRVLLGGAWAIAYFTTYAMYHFEASKIIDSQLLDQVLLAVVAFGMIGHSLAYRSQTLSAIALFIGYVTSCLGDVSQFTLTSAGILAIAALVLVYRLQWLRFAFYGIVLTYLTHFAWVIKQISFSAVPAGPLNVENVYFLLDAGFLCIYWAMFALSIHALKNEKEDPSFTKLAAANFSNFTLFFFMVFPKFHAFYPGQEFNFALGFGIIYLCLAFIMEQVRRNSMFISDIIVAVFLLTLAVPLKFMPYHTSVIWLIELPFLVLVGFIFKRPIYRYLAFVLMVVLFVKFIIGEWGSPAHFMIFSMRASWQAFISLMGVISTGVCYWLYRSYGDMPGEQESGGFLRPDTLLKNVYSAAGVMYLAMYLRQAVNPDWAAFSFSLASLAVFIAGAFLSDKFLRWYALAALAYAGVRFCFGGQNYADNSFAQALLAYGPAGCALAEYAIFKYLIKRDSVSANEALLSKPLFFVAGSLLVGAILMYVQHLWITVSLMSAGLGVLLWGARIKDKSIRIYSILIFVLAAIRFAAIDSYRSVDEFFQWGLIIAKLIFVYAAYFVYRGLNKRSELDETEKPMASSMFYGGSLLLVLAIFKYITSIWVSVSLGAVGVLLFVAGFLIKEKVFRHGGFIIFGLTLARVAFIDLSGLAIIYKIISFIIIGILFLGVSFIYTKYMTDKK
jgi:hypothetical protein